MKATLLFLTFSICSTFYAQDYIPMLQEDNDWSVDLHWYDYINEVAGITSFNILINGEIEFNGKIYKIIESNQGYCYLREENGIVYRYPDLNNMEYILYDFTLEAGDTFTLPYDEILCPFSLTNVTSSQPFEIISVTTQFIAGEDRKVLEVFNWETEYWIEGIGSTKGISPGGHSWHEYIELVCFTKNGDTTFFNDATSCDNTTLSVNDFSSEEIFLYPNPVRNISILQLPAETAVDQIKIYNINGKQVRDEKVTENYVTISNMDYASGLYFYQVFSENKLIKTDKFIVQ